MFNSNNSGNHSVANWFAQYREENNYLITRFKTILNYCKKLKNSGEYEKSEIIGRFSSTVQMEQIFDAFDINMDRILPIVEELVKCLEKEKKKLNEYFGKLKHEYVDSLVHLESLLITYNKEQYDLIQNLSTIIPNVIQLADRVVGTEDIALNTSGNNFEHFYLNLEKALKTNYDSPDYTSHLFNALEYCLLYLDKYVGDLEIFHRVPEDDFIAHLSNENAKKFVQNFFMLGQGKNFVKDLKYYLKKIGKDKDKEITYAQIEDEKLKKKVDEYMKKTLKALFKNIDEEEVFTGIDKIIKVPSDIKKLKEDFVAEYDKLVNKHLQNEKLESGVNYEDFEFTCDGLGEYVSFKDFMSDEHMKEGNESLVKKAIKQVKLLVGSRNDKQPYLRFKEHNVEVGKIDEDENDNGAGGDDTEKATQSEYDEFIRILDNVSSVLDGWLNPLNTEHTLDDGDKSNLKAFIRWFEDIKNNSEQYSCSKFNKVLNRKNTNIITACKDEINALLKEILALLEANDKFQINRWKIIKENIYEIFK